MTDIRHALLSPATVFKEPSEVLDCASLSQAEKIQVLEQWEYDTQELLTAAEENMTGDSEDVGELMTTIHQMLYNLRHEKD